MKRLIFIIICVAAVVSVNAQTKLEVISSSGGYNTATGLAISWTLGETLIPTLKSADETLALTHGFQEQLIVTAIVENIDVPVKVKVYPNPAHDVIKVLFEAAVEGEVGVMLLDSFGRLVKTDVIGDTMLEKEINLQDVPPGIYYLRLTKGKLVNVYKVVKL